jgi:benzil reductase ((S)-benzoin forming)
LSDLNALKEKLYLVFRFKENFERIVLINNAGTLGDVGPLGVLDNDQLEKLFNINITAPAILMNAFVEHYKTSSAEKIIMNISSGAGKNPVDGWSGYCASKAALDMISEVAAKEANLQGNSIKVFSVAPGVVDTEMQSQIRETDEQRFSGKKKFVNFKEQGQLADAGEVAGKLLKIIENAGKYDEVKLDVRNL